MMWKAFQNLKGAMPPLWLYSICNVPSRLLAIGRASLPFMPSLPSFDAKQRSFDPSCYILQERCI